MVDKKRKSGIDDLAGAMDLLGDSAEDLSETPSSEIKRTKHVVLQMMTDDEAIVQMEMLGHSYFVYLGEDGLTHIVYARQKGKGYGLLICE